MVEYFTERDRARAEARELARAGREARREETRAKREFERGEREAERLRRQYTAPSPPTVTEAPKVELEVREVGEPREKAKKRRRKKGVKVGREARRVMRAKEKPPYAIPLRHAPRKRRENEWITGEPGYEFKKTDKTDKEIISDFLS